MEPHPKRLRSELDSSDGKEVGQPAFSSAGKPKPCMKFFSTSGCPFGESCHFQHYVPGGLSTLGLSPVLSLSAAIAPASQKKAPFGPVGDPSVTVNGYKTKLCNRFNTPEGCRFGDRCHFAHGESDLRRPNSVPSANWQPMAHQPTMGAAPVGFSNSYEFPNSTGHVCPPGNGLNLAPQPYVAPIQPSASGNAGPVSYSQGPVASDNVPVY